jgi:hypothetical protein
LPPPAMDFSRGFVMRTFRSYRALASKGRPR